MSPWLWLLYLIIGEVLAIPYTLLSSGNDEAFVISACVLPAAIIFLCILRGASVQAEGRYGRWVRGLFWAILLYLCSPIILNGAALLVGSLGYEAAGGYVFAYRFSLIPGVPFLILTFLLLRAATIVFKDLLGIGPTSAPKT